MSLQPQTLEKLRIILKEDFGEEVTDAELFDIAHCLTGFYDKLMECYCEDLLAEQQKNERR